MNALTFEERYRNELGIYKMWGDTVTEYIYKKVAESNDPERFFKIEPKARVKSVDSIIAKAFYRGKDYKDLYEEITDKVGTRFVVLLTDHINLVKEIIEKNYEWVYSPDRDYELEKKEKPTVFEYQSVHYVVRCRNDIQMKDAKIPRGIPCEIQIRTLLQHAYAELTHDTIYKPIGNVPQAIHRVVAKSMALIETTDELFVKVNGMIEMEARERKLFIDKLYNYYKAIVCSPYEEKMNLYVLDSLKDLIKLDEADNIMEFIEENSYLKNKIKAMYNSNILYRQPIILLLYYLIDKKQRSFIARWPLPKYYLYPLFSDLGFSMPN